MELTLTQQNNSLHLAMSSRGHRGFANSKLTREVMFPHFADVGGSLKSIKWLDSFLWLVGKDGKIIY